MVVEEEDDPDDELTEIVLSRSLASAQFPTPVKFVVKNDNGTLRLWAEDAAVLVENNHHHHHARPGVGTRQSSRRNNGFSRCPDDDEDGYEDSFPPCSDPDKLRANLRKLLRRILPSELLRKIGFVGRGARSGSIDTAVVRALDAAGFASCNADVGSAECLVKNVVLLLKWTMAPAVLKQFTRDFRSIESIVAELIS